MSRSRHKRIALVFLLLLAVLVAAPVGLTLQQLRQERLNKALIEAARRADDKAAVSLLEEGADSNCREEPSRKASFWEVLIGWLKGMKPNQSNGPTPLLLSLWRRYPDRWDQEPINERLVRRLIEHGADLNAKVAESPEAPLPTGVHYPLSAAIDREEPEMVHLLLQRGASVTDAKADGIVVSAIDSCTSHPDVLADVLDHGADPNERLGSAPGEPALILAIDFSHIPSVKLLLAHHADYNARDDRNRTPLNEAERCLKGSPHDVRCRVIVHMLKATGAHE